MYHTANLTLQKTVGGDRWCYERARYPTGAVSIKVSCYDGIKTTQ